MHVAVTEQLELRPFQETGVRFLLDTTLLPPESATHKLLADEMGLGKTVQVCEALRRGVMSSAVIVCPHSLKTTWARQLIKWGACTAEQIFICQTGKDKIPPSATHVIMNPGLAIIKTIRIQVLNRWWDALVVDEAQCLKGLHSEITSCLLGVKGFVRRCKWKWLLSGTIMPNRPIELYPMLHTLAPSAMSGKSDYDEYGMYFCDGKEDKLGNMIYKGASNIDELRENLAPFMLRRTVEQVHADLPPVIPYDVFFDIGDMWEDDTNTNQPTLRKLVGLKKLPFVVDFVQEHMRMHPDEKVVVFAYHREVIEKFEEAMEAWSFVKFYGGMTGKEKEFTLHQFKNNEACRGLVGQIYAMGTGVDELQHTSNTVIHIEPDWQAGGWDQCGARLRRMGQTRPVMLYNCLAENTLDEPIDYSRRAKKRVMDRLLQPTEEKEYQMSLESELSQINASLKELIAVIKGGAVPAAAEEKAAGNKKGGGKKAEEAASTAKQESATSPATQQEAAPPAEQVVDIYAVKSAARAVLKAMGGAEGAADKAAKDAAARAAVQKVTAAVGADKLDNIPAEKLGEALALLQALLVAPKDDLDGI